MDATMSPTTMEGDKHGSAAGPEVSDAVRGLAAELSEIKTLLREVLAQRAPVAAAARAGPEQSVVVYDPEIIRLARSLKPEPGGFDAARLRQMAIENLPTMERLTLLRDQFLAIFGVEDILAPEVRKRYFEKNEAGLRRFFGAFPWNDTARITLRVVSNTSSELKDQKIVHIPLECISSVTNSNESPGDRGRRIREALPKILEAWPTELGTRLDTQDAKDPVAGAGQRAPAASVRVTPSRRDDSLDSDLEALEDVIFKWNLPFPLIPSNPEIWSPNNDTLGDYSISRVDLVCTDDGYYKLADHVSIHRLADVIGGKCRSYFRTLTTKS